MKCYGDQNLSSTYLSLEILQSMVVFLLVLTIIKGRPMAEFCEGVPREETRSLFLFIRFLKDNIYKYSIYSKYTK